MAGLHRFFVRRGLTRKKIGHAVEQDRPDILRQRRAWFDGQLDRVPKHLVFIDETWTATNMTRGTVLNRYNGGLLDNYGYGSKAYDAHYLLSAPAGTRRLAAAGLWALRCGGICHVVGGLAEFGTFQIIDLIDFHACVLKRCTAQLTLS